ncbi:hypothetical protein B6U81_03250 [Thermoplasmatales archaeon ex4484_30]|nr:MAG: hypothetical protein B6U81_03250 [Thermoplasmatales archaeon ex4484_30]
MAREGYRSGMEKYDFSFTSISRIILLFLIPFTAYSLGLLPCFASFIFFYRFFDFGNVLHIIIFPFFLVAEFLLFIVCESIVPGIFIKIFRIRCEEGEHELSIKDKNFFKLALHAMLYRPPLMLLAIFKLLPLRMLFLKLAGLKIGKTSLIPGTEIIYDPYVTEIGEQTLLGGYVKIAGHVVEDKLIIKKVKIGNNCLIGLDTVIFPGAVIEDDVTIGAKSLVLKNQVLKKGKMYGGVPAKEIGEKRER